MTLIRGFSFTLTLALAGTAMAGAQVAVPTYVDNTDFLHLTHQSVGPMPALLTCSDSDCADSCGGGTGDCGGTVVPLLDPRVEEMVSWLVGGVTVGDVDGDTDLDLYVIGGANGASKLFIYAQATGKYVNTAANANVEIVNEYATGPLFVDYDGDGDQDLFVGSALYNQATGVNKPHLFENVGAPDFFVDVFDEAFPGFKMPNTWSVAFGDYDEDGDLDCFMAHSMMPPGPNPACLATGGTLPTQHLWRNKGRDENGRVTFEDVSVEAGISGLIGTGTSRPTDQTFTPNFTDWDNDGDLDLFVAADTGTSYLLRNEIDPASGQHVFVDFDPGGKMSGQASMGAAVGDFDNDGDFDVFTAEIHAANSIFVGNRFYLDPPSSQIAPAAGVEAGFWGWSASDGDLNNDGWLDIVHVNGFYFDCINAPPPVCLGACRFASVDWTDTPPVAFLGTGLNANAVPQFVERAAAMGIALPAEGRGIAVFDRDLDGDLDIAISNHNGPFKMYDNQTGSAAGAAALEVKLRGRSPNTDGVGARLELTSQGAGESGIKVREIRAGNNFQSSNGTVAHFGLGAWGGPFDLEVRWPLGGETTAVVTAKPAGSARRRSFIPRCRRTRVATGESPNSRAISRGGLPSARCATRTPR